MMYRAEFSVKMNDEMMEFYGPVPLWWFASVSAMTEMQERYQYMQAPNEEEKAKGMTLKLVRENK